MADPRYLEAWKKPPSSQASKSRQTTALPSGYGFTGSGAPKPAAEATNEKKAGDKSTKSTTATAAPLNVRLDTPGGVTYSPSDLGSHNVIKRMFIPYRLGDTSLKKEGKDVPEGALEGAVVANRDGVRAYDFGPDLSVELADPEISEARKYALSVDLDRLTGRPEGGHLWSELHKEEDDDQGQAYAGSTSGKTTASVRTTATTTTLATQRPDGSLPEWYMRPSAKKDVAPFVVPPSYTGRAADLQRPWDAMRWNAHRALERPSRRDREQGIASFEDVNGPGRVPSLADTPGDGGSIASTVRPVDGFSVADLFLIDPRISRPQRMVRRTDPRQVLLLCSGVYMGASQVATMRAAQAARDAGLNPSDINSSKQAQEMLLQLAKTSEARGGIGVLFCPSDEPLSQDEDALRRQDPRFEINTCKRLEGTPTSARNSERRAHLRAVLAALELANWEEEGFDKIVIGVDQPWIVRGLTVDIWTWRKTGWTLTENSALGAPGESVPDRDVWELIDDQVRKYESIDCNVRFWHVVKERDMALTRKLALQGAMKQVAQRPALVRWRKKPAPTLVDEAERRKRGAGKAAARAAESRQGPTLMQVR